MAKTLDHRSVSEPPAQRPPGVLGSSPAGVLKVAWREGTLTRASEIEALVGAFGSQAEHLDAEDAAGLRNAIGLHLAAARDAARASRWQLDGPLIERAMSNLDAAEADLLQLADEVYVVGQMANMLNHVQRHLAGNDPRRIEVERIAERLGVIGLGAPGDGGGGPPRRLGDDRLRLVSAVRGASSAALREQTRVRSFRNAVAFTAAGMAVVAIGLVVFGALQPSSLPMCFEPSDGTRIDVVCPTDEDVLEAPNRLQIDNAIRETAHSADLFLIALLGVAASSVAAAAAIRGIKGSSEPYGVPIALAVLKLPTGAVTAVLGLLLMRGAFIPGLSALDSSAQILAWAVVFGYAQQLFTRLVDQQAHAVLDGVRGEDRKNEATRSG